MDADFIRKPFVGKEGRVGDTPLYSIKFLFNVSVSVDAAGYVQKAGLFALSVIAGYLIYTYFVKNSALIRRMRGVELSFRGICVSIGVFFAVILLAARLM